MKRWIRLLPFIVLMPLVFAACGDDDDDAPVTPTAPKTVTGTWDVMIGTDEALWNIKETNGVLSGSFSINAMSLSDLAGTISSSGSLYLESKAEWRS